MASIIPESADDKGARAGLTRIVVTGSESTGKTQLAEQLAAHYGVPWVPEFARDYAEQKGRPLTSADVTPIGSGQMTREDAAMRGLTGMIVFDTDLLSTVGTLSSTMVPSPRGFRSPRRNASLICIWFATSIFLGLRTRFATRNISAARCMTPSSSISRVTARCITL